MWRLSLLGLCLIFSVARADDAVQCKDENGNSVDWFVMYKIDRQSTASDPLIKKGEAYVYITSGAGGSGWQLTKKGVESQSGMLAHTLNPIYNTGGKKNIRVLYNDHRPGGSAVGTRGHTKGVVIANEDEGFWLVHSVPQFPEEPEGSSPKYDFPESGKKYAQSFLCISVKSNQVETIAKQLYFNQAISYYARSTKELQDKYPTLVKVVEGKFRTESPFTNIATIHSAAGLSFISFAKSDQWHYDLYHEWVAPQLHSPLNVQSWRSGTKLDSDCSGTAVYNIESVVIKIPGVSINTIHSGVDHSKWATTTGAGYVCIGDINRVATQKNRGGGTVCVQLPKLWNSYSGIIHEVEKCK